MRFAVILLPRAKLQLHEAASWWAQHRSALQATRWLAGFEQALASLEVDPERCGLAREDGDFPFTVRQLLFGLSGKKTHRAVFEIRGREVLVYAIRHLAQQDLTPDDI